MQNRTSIITLAAIAVTGVAAIITPTYAQIAGGAAMPPRADNAGATTGGHASSSESLGVPNVTLPGVSVRQGAAGINSAEAEATRTTGDPVADAQARAENEIARSGLPGANAPLNTPGAANDAARDATRAANRGAGATTGAEAQTNQQHNRGQETNVEASANVSTHH